MAVIGDQDALKQVLLILMDNALKHTTGPITVAGAIVDESVRISVHDAGPAIDPAALPHIFERFYRGGEAQDKSGIGLGLPIATALIEAQDGTITAESQVDKGNVFVVTLPRAVTAHEDSEAT
jgi:signal transduction histidine kinase